VILDIADWSYYRYGIERVKLAWGTLVNGTQMFVEHWIPTVVRHPYAVVLVHGGYGQASDWMSTPDGRRGWASLFLEQGYKVYLVDRPARVAIPIIHGCTGFTIRKHRRSSASRQLLLPRPGQRQSVRAAAAMGTDRRPSHVRSACQRSKGIHAG
jgi:hypothetical protein